MDIILYPRHNLQHFRLSFLLNHFRINFRIPILSSRPETIHLFPSNCIELSRTNTLDDKARSSPLSLSASLPLCLRFGPPLKTRCCIHDNNAVAPSFEIMRVFIDLHLDLSRHDAPPIHCGRLSHVWESHNRMVVDPTEAEWHASLTRIFLILSRGGNQTGYQTDQSSSRKIHRKEFSLSLSAKGDDELLLFERIFSRMIHWPRGDRFVPSLHLS